MIKKLSKIFILTLFTAIFTLGNVHTSDAILYEIIASPQSTTGFTHNTFHGYDGAGTLAWFDLDTSKTNTYDPDTGDLSAHFKLYNNDAFDTLWGTATATGNIPGANLGSPFTGALGGNIIFLFDFPPLSSNSLSDYLGGVTSVDILFYDTDYDDTNFGTDVNSWDQPYLSLWGAGEFDYAGGGGYVKTDLGMDVVLQTGQPVVPEPATMLLFGSGLLGGIFARRKKRS